MSSSLFASYLPAGSSCAAPVPVCAPACPPAPVCAPVCAPNPCATRSNCGSGMFVGGGIAAFLIIWVFMWIVFASFNPWFVRRVERGEEKACETAPACLTRVFVASLVAALIISAIIWLIAACS